jgi:hypothetical protein
MQPDRHKKAALLLAEIDGLFFQAEKASPNGEVTYLDIVRIADWVRDRFHWQPPPEIEHALNIACGLCNPNTAEGRARVRKSLAALLGLGGGMALFWGILYVIAHGVVLTTVTGILWWKTTAVVMLVGGPVGIGLGLAAMLVGLYVFVQRTSPKKLAITALDVMRVGINRWAGHWKPNSFVSILVTIVNHSERRLVRLNFTSSSGKYTVEPSRVIEHGDAFTFCLESCGFMTGAVGKATYTLEPGGSQCCFEYSAPFIGANHYDYDCPGRFEVERTGGDGYAAQVAYIVRPAHAR